MPSLPPSRSPLRPSRARELIPQEKKPDWFRVRPPAGERVGKIREMLRERKLHTVCEEARCPNLGECWAGGTATLMVGSDTCTRACRFCAVKTARVPPPLDPEEPRRVAESVAELDLDYVVITSVDRDDLEDGGSSHIAATVRELKRTNPDLLVEALVPDFRGREDLVHTIVRSGLDVYAHNVETVRALHKRVRDPRADYDQSLRTLSSALALAKTEGRRMFTKSSLMLGLGEGRDEILQAMEDMREHGVSILTLGQYLRPSLEHLPVERFVHPEEFDELAEMGKKMGFLYVASGPLVRSSYRAGEFFIRGILKGESHGV